jgi:hypothetical protein
MSGEIRIDEMVPMIDSLREQLTIAKAERDEARNTRDGVQQKLSDLLCIIHRDGGHYLDEHGVEKACFDAHALVIQNWGDLNKLAEAFESAMTIVKDKVQAAYVSAFMAGRVLDERVDMKDATIMQQVAMDAMASFGKFMEHERKRVADRQQELSAAKEHPILKDHRMLALRMLSDDALEQTLAHPDVKESDKVDVREEIARRSKLKAS